MSRPGTTDVRSPRRRRATALALLAALPLLAAGSTAGTANAATVTSPWTHATLGRASVAANGAQATGSSFFASISGTGRYVALRTNARNLFPGYETSQLTVVKDRQTGKITPVTLRPDGKPSAGTQLVRTSISADGRYVAFCSMATDLVTGLPPYVFAIRVFVRDTVTGTTSLASIDANGQPFTYDAAPPALSPDGHSVAFIVGGQVYVRDLVAGRTVRASVPPTGQPDFGGNFGFPALSSDGRRVAFAQNVPYQGAVVYVRDLTAGTTTVASTNSSGATVLTNLDSPSLSADGRYVTFATDAPDMVTGASNSAKIQVYRHDLTTGRNVRISVNRNGAGGNEGSSAPSISGDGRYVAFVSLADDLIAGDTDALLDIFVRDVDAGTTTRVTTTADGQPPTQVSPYLQAFISTDGRSVLFQSTATNLVPYDTNGAEDVFVSDAH